MCIRDSLRGFAESPSRFARRVVTLLEQPRNLLITILFGNLVVNVSFYAVASVTAWHYAATGRELAATVFGVTALLVVIVLGEVDPKAVALAVPETVARFAAFPLLGLRTVITPIRFLVSHFSRAVTNLLVHPHHRGPYVTADELKMLVNLSRQQGLIDDQTGSMMQELVDFARIRVHEVMVPRVDLTLCEVDKSVDEFLNLVAETRHGRIPVYEGNIDNVIGIVHVKDVLVDPKRPLRDHVRPVLFVPTSKTIESLLTEFRQKGESLAMVVDEYGGIAGMVTLEDVTEEIVGETVSYTHLTLPTN